MSGTQSGVVANSFFTGFSVTPTEVSDLNATIQQAQAAATSASAASAGALVASQHAQAAALSASAAASTAQSAITTQTNTALGAINSAVASATAQATSDAGTASSSASAASTSASAAAASATTAAQGQAVSTSNAIQAAASAMAATTSATNAGNSATSAATSATNAGNSASAAATSAANVSGALQNYVPLSGGVMTGFLQVDRQDAAGNDGTFHLMTIKGQIIGSIATGTGTGVTFNTASDYRLKGGVAPMAGALRRVAALTPKKFYFHTDPAQTVVDGFIAHEIAGVVPEAVSGTKDAVDASGTPIHQMVDHSRLVPVLWAAVNELAADFAAYKATHP